MSSTVIFVPDEAGFQYVEKAPDGPVGQDLLKRGERIRALAYRQVGRKTGRLAATLTVDLSLDAQGLIVRVGSADRIALIHHNGTRPHLIHARGTGMLRFSSKGKVVYAHLVKHPGTKPNRYLTDNLRRVMND